MRVATPPGVYINPFVFIIPMVISLAAEAGDDQLSNFLLPDDAQQVAKMTKYFGESSNQAWEVS